MTDYVSLEARVMLCAILCVPDALEDVAADVETMQAAQLLQLVALASSRLRELSSSPPQGEEISIRVTKDYRIFSEYPRPRELVLQPLSKTLLLLLLSHPDGVDFSRLHSYRRELIDLYSRISPRLDMDALTRSIDTLLDSRSNSFRQQKSRLSAAISLKMDIGTLQSVKVVWE